ncbi:MAG: 16S rRNA (cytosine(1402)-N(4))-methyltransferase RsmH [Alphaproteobacteria bacterium]|nr:16S rRNA (cytosine(1402)-N(4))-methyltransferase RsmH [Alphaproteobacteria bacterium]
MNHIPVLLDEVLRTLGNVSGKVIADCTFGAGGYSRAFLERGANVIAFDRDPSVLPTAQKLTAKFPGKFELINKPFSNLKSQISNFKSQIDAIVFDFGVSSMQIDTAERGFSWRFDAPLDMRMDTGAFDIRPLQTAAQLIEISSVANLVRILREYGDVKKASAIARAMKEKLPQTTFELRDLIYNPKDIAPVFQALRIAVNDELGEIAAALSAVPELLAPGGVCVCVTFHSLEDRLVKNTFREWTTAKGDPKLPTAPDAGAAPMRLLKTATPTDAEIAANPRARSAHMRAVIMV